MKRLARSSFVVVLVGWSGIAAAQQPDLVFASRSYSTDRYCANDGAGSFTCSDFGFSGTDAVALEDMDGSNGVDAVFAVPGWRNNVCLNDGAASFTCTEVSLDANDSYGVALGDADGDGDIDAFFANDDGPHRACLNDGAVSFTCEDIGSDVIDSRAVATIPPWNFCDGFESGDTTRWTRTELE